jgi:hypothetical protein
MTDEREVSAADVALENLAAGIEWARILGLDTTAAEAVAAEAGAEDAGARAAVAGAAGTSRANLDGRTALAARAALADLAAAAGIQGPVRDLVIERWRRRATDASVSELAALLDMDGLERGAVAATQARAQREGGGPTRPFTAVRLRRRQAEPVAVPPRDHLPAWRSRGDLGPVTDLVTQAVERALPQMPPALRPGYVAACDASDLEGRIAAALDRIIAREAPEAAEPPTSRLWRTFGLLQWLNLLLLLAAVAWTVIGLNGQAPVPTQQVPLIGRVPVPAMILGLALIAAALLAVGLRVHADRMGRRWARRLEVLARIGARQVVEGQAFSRIDRLESARLRLAGVARRA